VPRTVVTLFAEVLTVEPPPDGVSAMETLAGAMVPVGNPLPVRVMLVIPACPDEGVIEERDTGVGAVTPNAPTALNTTKQSIETSKKGLRR
jgi:hypothetical protein